MNLQQQFTAVDLIDKVIEFERRWPNQQEWVLEKIPEDNLSKYIRLKRINTLAKAFLSERLLQLSLRDIMNILLNKNRKNFVEVNAGGNGFSEVYAFLIQEIIRDIQNLRPEISSSRMEYISKYIWLNDFYKDLIYYKKKLYYLFTPDGIILEGDLNHTYCADMTYMISQEIKQLIESKFPGFNHIIRCCIDPEKRVFTLEQLIENYDYPDFDIEDYEMDLA